MSRLKRSGNDASRRTLRVEREIREVIGSFLLSGFRGRLSGLTSVSRVGVSGDLRQGNVYVSIMGTPEEKKANLKELQDNAFDIQAHVNHKLKMKFCPKLRFFLDDSMENVLKVESILRDLGQNSPSHQSEDRGNEHVDGTDDDEDGV